MHEQVEPDRKTAELARLTKEATEVERQIKRLTELLGQSSMPDPLLRQIEAYEKRRIQLVENIETLAEIERDADKVRNITEDQVARVMRGLAEAMQCLDRDALKDFVRGLLKKVELDVARATYQITYRLNAGDKVASPRGFVHQPGFSGDGLGSNQAQSPGGLTAKHGRLAAQKARSHLLTFCTFSKVRRPPIPSMPVMTTHSRSRLIDGGTDQPLAVPYQTRIGCTMVA